MPQKPSDKAAKSIDSKASATKSPLPKRLNPIEGSVRAYLPKKPRRSIKLDRIHPTDLRRFELRFFCEDCSHYSASKGSCTFGFRAQHTRAEQMAIYERTGQMALCRALEID
jgi:hypothetical protein